MPRRRLPADGPSSKNAKGSKQQRSSTRSDVPDIYRDMLAEAAVASDPSFIPDVRSSKRRKISPGTSDKPPQQEPLAGNVEPPNLAIREGEQETASSHGQQVIYDDLEGSDVSDADFEDVELEPAEESDENEQEHETRALQIDLSKPTDITPRKDVHRRKPASKSERDFRLNVHKWHLLCLLLHLRCRNHWCDSTEVHSILKPLVPRKVVTLLHCSESKPQYQRVHSFSKAIEELCAFWAGAWQVTAPGLRKAAWREAVDVQQESETAEDPIEFDDFKRAARSRQGSRDLGAQLFCSLLRSVAVDTRLVFSLQTLPFSGVSKEATPTKPKSKYIYAPAQAFSRPAASEVVSDMPDNTYWRMSDHTGTAPPPQLRAPTRKIRDSPFPIFWVEVFSPAATAWIPVDPLVRHTINKPKTGFEPSASDSLNQMSYVVAFEDDGSAKDVTRRYTQFYNAKTRKLRVESTKGGQRWWAKTLTVFEKPFTEDRDVVEDVELAKREAAEPMPKNVQDFKDHPIYVLERHLRQNEVIHPKREAGKVGTGVTKGRHGKAESVYRRQDVHVVRSADQWYRRGRDIKQGENGLRRRQLKQNRAADDEHSDEDGEDSGSMLYAEFQTDVYIPPPVVRGKVPKNAYGNLDIYVPTMIPAGAIHVQHPDASKAAKVLGVSYADAVTGFDFKGRQGTARISGVVVPLESRDAVVETIETLQHERITAEEARKSALMLRLWKRFLTALRIRQKVEHDYGSDDAENKGSSVGDDENDGTYQDDETEDAGGGFFFDDPPPRQSSAGIEIAMPPIIEYHKTSFAPEDLIYREVVVIKSPHTVQLTKEQISTPGPAEEQHSSNTEAGDFMFGDEDPNVGTPIELSEAGGFMAIDQEAEQPGGFLPEEREERAEAQHDTILGSLNPENGDSKKDIPLNGEINPGGNEIGHPDVDAVPGSTSKDAEADSHTTPSNHADNESLVSHDPEDEEADPEWLVDSS